MTEERLRLLEARDYWPLHGYAIPGVAIKYVFLRSGMERIDAVYFKVYGSDNPVCYYFDVTKVVVTPRSDASAGNSDGYLPNNSPEPTPGQRPSASPSLPSGAAQR